MTPTTEEWRAIPGFPGYEVSTLGRVMSYRRPKPVVLKPHVTPKGYHYVALSRGNYDVSRLSVHRVVMLTFVGPRPEGLETRHLDGNSANNALSNLVYGTRAENIADACAHGNGYSGGKTHCPAGHPYDEANTRVTKHGRRCRTCQRSARAEWRRRKGMQPRAPRWGCW